MLSIDLNCDMGEGMHNDDLLMPFITSANIACGFHAGNETIMKQTIELATKYNVAIGAHPGFPDKANFGRTEMKFSAGEVYNLIANQVNALQLLCKQVGATLHHVKPHGALYNMAAKNPETAYAIACAAYDIDKQLILYGLSGSSLITEGKRAGLKTAAEVFADRTYKDDGSLTPRSETNAIISGIDQSISQVLQMIQQKNVTSVTGKKVNIIAETICLHGDGEHALEFANAIKQTLRLHNIEIKAN